MHKPIRMSMFLPVGTLVFGLCLAVGAVDIGDSREQTIRELGRPQGSVTVGSYEILLFTSAEITLQDERVISTTRIRRPPPSQRRPVARQAEQTKTNEAATAANYIAKLPVPNVEGMNEEEASWERVRLGRLERFNRLRDKVFANLPAAERAAFWKAFQERFPDIDVSSEYEAAKKEADAEEAARIAKESEPDQPGSEAEAQENAEPDPRLSSSKRRKLARSGTGDVENRPAFLQPVRKFKP